MKTKILDQIRGSEQGMLQLLEELVNIDSGADALAGINAVAQRIGAFLEVLGFTVEYLETDGAPVQLLARKAQPGKKQVLFSGHMDTVFNQGTAAVRPFKVENGRAYGPGVLDMKGGLVMALYVIRALLENGWQETDMTVLLCGDEEMSHPFTDAVAQFKKAGAGKDAVFNLEFGRVDGSVVTGRKGTTRPTLVVEGIASHAGNEPEKGASAILELPRRICKDSFVFPFTTEGQETAGRILERYVKFLHISPHWTMQRRVIPTARIGQPPCRRASRRGSSFPIHVVLAPYFDFTPSSSKTVFSSSLRVTMIPTLISPHS